MKTVCLLILACVVVVVLALVTANRGAVFQTAGPRYRSFTAAAPVSNPVPWPFRTQSPPAAPASSRYTPSYASSQSSLPPQEAAPNFFSKILGDLQQKFHSATEHHKTCHRSELRIVRGIVVDQVADGLILDCSGWLVYGTQVPVYPGDGEGMNIIYANLVDAHEQFQFGRLMMVDNGIARQSLYDRSTWNLDSYVSGRVLLKNYPPVWPPKGKGFKVVAISDGEGTWQGQSIVTYTASFTLLD